MASFTTFVLIYLLCEPCKYSIFDIMSVVVNNYCLVSSNSPLLFQIFPLGVSDSLGDGKLVFGETISVLDLLHLVKSIISDRFSPRC